MKVEIVITLILSVFFGLPMVRQSSPADGRFDSAGEREMVRLVNAERAKAGLPALEVDDRLTQAARAHTVLMAQQEKLAHQFPGEAKLSERLHATGIRFNNDGENVAFDSGTASDAHQGLMNSPPHRANILSPAYNAIGIGVMREGDLLYVTEDFAHRLQEYSAPQAEDQAAEAFTVLRQKRTTQPAQRRDGSNLRRLACSMAQQDRLITKIGLSVPGAHYAVAYTEGEPQKLPSSAVQLASDHNIKAYAVGACYATSEKYPTGTWWVLMVFY